MLNIPSPLSEKTEALVKKVIGCCIEVHRVLGPGMLESIYVRATCLELDAAGIAYERERLVAVQYKGVPVAHHRLDMVVENQLVLELKGVERLLPVHRAQLLGYLRASKIKVGLLINFNVAVLRDGIKRVIIW
jgi:GxxExxY protein